MYLNKINKKLILFWDVEVHKYMEMRGIDPRKHALLTLGWNAALSVEFIMTFISSYFSFKFAYRDLVSVTPNQHEYLNIVLSVI